MVGHYAIEGDCVRVRKGGEGEVSDVAAAIFATYGILQSCKISNWDEESKGEQHIACSLSH